MKNISCCFTGHRDIPRNKYPEIAGMLYNEIITLIEKGYTHFFAGGALGFDTLAAETVLALKKDYPEIKLHIIIPCKNQTRGWREEDIIKYNEIKELADFTECLSPIYYDGCMQARNRYMVDHSSVCIAYLTRLSGGSAGTVRYAEKNGVQVINLSGK
ncbi:MAG: DUF1273 family protein [Clostridia bacterium]|nr:DUF1273 family protein [Clostridia bacterium]